MTLRSCQLLIMGCGNEFQVGMNSAQQLEMQEAGLPVVRLGAICGAFTGIFVASGT
jgi:hypothetical protein